MATNIATKNKESEAEAETALIDKGEVTSKAPSADPVNANKATVKSKPLKVKSSNFKYTGKRRVHRHITPPNIPKSERVHKPVEAQKIRRMTIERIGYVSQSNKLRNVRIRSLKARRTLTLAPAPTPVTAPKTRFGKETHKFFSTILSHLSRIDYLFVFSVIALAVIGVFAVHSASRNPSTNTNPLRYDIMEIGCFCIGIFSLFILSMFDYSTLNRRTKYIIALNVAVCLYTLIFGYSIHGDSNRNWVDIFGIGIQPAEFSKVLFILSLSSHLHSLKDNVNSLRSLVQLGAHGLLIIGLILLQGDLGNASVFMIIFVVMCFAARMNIWYFVGAMGIAVCASPLIWQRLQNYQQKRILAGFNPDLDPLDSGYQAIRARNAIASGGITGKGYMQGYATQSRTAIFSKESDMIFGTIGEEGGLIMCATIVILYTVLIFEIIKISLTAKDRMGTYLCAGVAAMIAYQFMISVGMCMGNLPVVGITLPLISYGGSSLLTSYISLTLVLSVHTSSNKYSYI